MKRVRVLVRFEEINEDYDVLQSERPDGFKFGAVTTEDFGSAEAIAEKLGGLVTETISQHFSAFLEDK